MAGPSKHSWLLWYAVMVPHPKYMISALTRDCCEFLPPKRYIRSLTVLQDGHETDYVLPQPDVTEDLNDFLSALKKLEATVEGSPAPILDDQQARRLSHATRAPAAAMLAAIWSPRLAEPLQSISPSLASVAHAEMLNGLTMAASDGFPSMV